MKTPERPKAAAEEQRRYASAATPPTAGALMKAEPADPAQAGPGQQTGAGLSGRRLGWIVGIYVVVATTEVALGRWFDSIYWASVAFFFAVTLQPRERVPKLLRYFAIAAMLVLTVVQVVMLILQLKGG